MDNISEKESTENVAFGIKRFQVGLTRQSTSVKSGDVIEAAFWHQQKKDSFVFTSALWEKSVVTVDFF